MGMKGKGGESDDVVVDLSDVVLCVFLEVEVYVYLVVLMYLIDGERGEDAFECAREAVDRIK